MVLWRVGEMFEEIGPSRVGVAQRLAVHLLDHLPRHERELVKRLAAGVDGRHNNNILVMFLRVLVRCGGAHGNGGVGEIAEAQLLESHASDGNACVQSSLALVQKPNGRTLLQLHRRVLELQDEFLVSSVHLHGHVRYSRCRW